MADIVNLKQNRRDHYIPQGFLRGFIDPSRLCVDRPLWYFDVPTSRWFERSTREIAYRHGFYDYATTANLNIPTADETFAYLERRYPTIRRSLIENNFCNWKEHLDFLLRYAQMMRARSLLFIEQRTTEWREASALTITSEVFPDGKTVGVKSMTPEPLSHQFIRNRIIIEMREEIKKDSAWLKDLHWCLRYSDFPSRPFVISENPLVCSGPCSGLTEAIKHPDTLIFFPLCWQACLIGSRQSFHKETDFFRREDIYRTQELYRACANLFVVSPTRLGF